MMGQIMSGYTVVGSSSVDQGQDQGPIPPQESTSDQWSQRTVKVVRRTTKTHTGDQVITTTEGGTTKIMTTQMQEGGREVTTVTTTSHTGHQEPRELNPAQYFQVGSDYTHLQGEYAPRGPVNRYGVPVGTPINRIIVEKLQAPKVASSMRELFETGQVPDLQKRPQKIQIVRDDAPEAGVYESQPTKREDVVRESDEVTAGEVLEEGTTKNIVHAWKDITAYRGTEPKMSTIKIDTELSGPAESENQPIRLDGVIREHDVVDEVRAPEDGYTDKLRFKFLYPEETKLERGPIKLVENENEPVVYENEPSAPREGVIRSDFEEEQMSYEPGYIRNVAGFFATVSDDTGKRKAPMVLDRSNVVVLESEPVTREGVVRESDVQDVDAQLALEQGRTRNLAGRWQNMKDEGPRKGQFQMDLAPEAGVLENEPVILENVIRCDAPTEDVMLPGAPGGIKSIAGRFKSPTREEGERKGMIEIDMAQEAGVVENTPAELAPGIVRCDEYTSDQRDVNVGEGTARGLHDKWRHHEEEHMKVRTALDFQGDVPIWIKEMESKGNGGIFENEPEYREGVVREADIAHDEAQEELIPSNMSKSLKSMWLTRESKLEQELEESRRYVPEPIRFTPPRDYSPTPASHETTSSFQSITLSDQPAENDVDASASFDTSETLTLSKAPAPAKTEKRVTQRTERKKVAPHTAPKSQGVKSSATLVFT